MDSRVEYTARMHRVLEYIDQHLDHAIGFPKAGCNSTPGPFFEHYPTDSTFDPRTGMFACELCIPAAAL